MSKPASPYTISLANVRLSFPHIFKAHAMEEGQEPRFSAAFLLDKKKHATLIAKVEKMIEDLKRDTWKGKGTVKGVCLRDGADKPEIDGYGDEVMFITASNKTRPVVVDRDPSIPIAEGDANAPYAGCYVNASINLWAQDNKFGRRINAGLRAVQFIKDGEPFGEGKIDPLSEFENLEDDLDL